MISYQTQLNNNILFYKIYHIPVDQFIYESGNSSRWFKYAYIGLTILGVILITKDKIAYCIAEAIDMTTHVLEGRRRRQRERQRELEQQQRLEREWQQQRERERQREQQRQQERERLLQNRVAVVVVGASKSAERVTKGLEKQQENRSDETDLCVICLEKKYNAVYVPCHHMCCCITCSLRVKTCPLCRKPIGKVLQIYRH